MGMSGGPEFGKGQLLIGNGNPRMSYCKWRIVGNYPCRSYLNIASVLLVGALAWSVATLSLPRHKPGNATAIPEELRGTSSRSPPQAGPVGQSPDWYEVSRKA